MKQKILFVVFLLFISGGLPLFCETTDHQGFLTDTVAQEEIRQVVIPTDTVPPTPRVPRIRYRDLINQLSDSITGLLKDMESISTALEKTTQERDSIKQRLEGEIPLARETEIKEDRRSLLGIKMAPGLFNIVLILFFVLAIIALAIAFLYCKRVGAGTLEKDMKYKELVDEFESYRKASRERFEKQAIDHFNELKKLGKR